MHRAETTVIPLGERDGFPTSIDFDNLDQRLEAGFIHDRLRRVIAKPHISKFFLRAQKEIEAMGLAKWKALANQGSESTLSIATPGYYGDLGRAIIIQHFQLLTKWGMMRPLSKEAILPLSTTDFIATVLVPEAAVLLIMEDQGWSGNPSGSRWKLAMREAMDIRTRSAEYGHWRFREDGVGQAVLARLKSAEEEKKRRVEEVEMRPGGEARPVVVSSASEAEFGEEEDEGYWDEMERVAWVSEMKHTRFDEEGRPITENGGEGSVSGRRARSSSVSSTEDGWTIDAGEAVAKMDEVMREHARAG